MVVNWREHIVCTPGVRSGKPRIDGTRVTVQDVLSYLAAGMSIEEFLADWDYLSRDQVLACLAFAAERESLFAPSASTPS